ncbi:hypothetical protein [Nocardia sp. BMG51109]|uniref:hypothetical protein n=1 Tax=Nocardia sp. BMG51109 TaxID=1056816 RepID=UPI0004644E80|nr:hypothetical protein [Nocardia sp. BMG51109]
MLDRFGWQLQVGDAVTVRGSSDGVAHLHGSQGVIAGFDEDRALVELIADASLYRYDDPIPLYPHDLEYGRVGVTIDADLRDKMIEDCARIRMESVVEAGIEESLLTPEQGEWLRKRMK